MVNYETVKTSLGEQAAMLAVCVMKMRMLGFKDNQVLAAIRRVFVLRQASAKPTSRDKLAEGRVVAAQELGLDLAGAANILWTAADQVEGMTNAQITAMFNDIRPFISNPEPQ